MATSHNIWEIDLDRGQKNPLNLIFKIGEPSSMKSINNNEGELKLGKTVTRTFDLVEMKEVEALFNLLKNNHISEHTAMIGIGYKNGGAVLVEARKIGLCKRSIY